MHIRGWGLSPVGKREVVAGIDATKVSSCTFIKSREKCHKDGGAAHLQLAGRRPYYSGFILKISGYEMLSIEERITIIVGDTGGLRCRAAGPGIRSRGCYMNRLSPVNVVATRVLMNAASGTPRRVHVIEDD